MNHHEYTSLTNEPLGLLEFHWESIGKSEDPFAPHQLIANQRSLLRGDTIHVSFSDELTLVDSAQYKLTLVGFDLAKNHGDTVFIEPINYEISPPIISYVLPINDSFVNSINVSYLSI